LTDRTREDPPGPGVSVPAQTRARLAVAADSEGHPHTTLRLAAIEQGPDHFPGSLADAYARLGA